MNTIPLIFNERQIPYTVIGGSQKKRNNPLNISAILLSTNGNFFKNFSLEILTKCNFTSIICVEKNNKTYILDDFVKKFPSVDFIIPQESVTIGDMINIAISNVKTDYVLVIRDNVKISTSLLNNTILSRITEKNKLCIVPMLLTENNQNILMENSPSIQKNRLKIDSSSLIREDTKTIYPFDFIGVYNVQKFIQCGGFDYTITSPYWQNVDFFMRAWLWGESCVIMPSLRMIYEGDIPVEDSTINNSYLRFFLKNVSPQIKTTYAYIPIKSFFPYLISSRQNFIEAATHFFDARLWVEKNKDRFKYDIKSLIDFWNKDR